MANDINTLGGALSELGETMSANLTAKGVTANPSDGLTTLATKILSIPTGGGGGSSNVVQGTFTTTSTRTGTGTVNLDYNGNGYPIACIIFIDGGAYNSATEYYSSVNRYDVGFYSMAKAVTDSTPTYVASSSLTQNQATVSIIYKNSTSSATSYRRTSGMNVITYNSSNATTHTNCIRFKNNATTLTYYVGNKASNTVGFAPSTTYAYIVIYSE